MKSSESATTPNDSAIAERSASKSADPVPLSPEAISWRISSAREMPLARAASSTAADCSAPRSMFVRLLHHTIHHPAEPQPRNQLAPERLAAGRVSKAGALALWLAR